MAALVTTREKAGPAGPAGGGRDEGVFEAHALRGEAVNVWSLDHGMTGAPEGMIALVVGKQEQDVWSCRAGSRKEEAQQENVETTHGG